MEHTTIAVDLAKSVFQVAVSRRPGHVDEERRLSRARFLTYLAQQAPPTVVVEACGSAHYWAPQLHSLGHSVRLLPAHDVHRYVRRNKTDRTDTKALLEANRNEEIHPVPVKSAEQQAIASLHRLRSTWQATRTSRLNTIRGLLREFGVTIPVGASQVVPQVRECLGHPATPIPVFLHVTLTDACDEIRELEMRMRGVDRQLEVLAQEMPDVVLLQTVPGVGLITATALVALVGHIRRFRSGRHFASYLGLTPRRGFDRVAPPPWRDQQAGRYLPPNAVDPRRALVPLSREIMRAPDGLAMLGPAHASGGGTTSRPSPSRISSRELSGLSGDSSDRLHDRRPSRSDGCGRFRLRRRTASSSIVRWRTGRTGAGPCR